MSKIVVIGAGPSGLMAAGTALKSGHEVTILDRNGIYCRKLRITGKGRCNVTNCCDVQTLMNNIPQNPKFLQSAFSRFASYDTMNFFEEMGVKLKVERGNRVFPVSDNAADIAEALKRYVSGAKEIQENAVDIQVQDGRVCAVLTDKRRIECSCALIASGGMSYPSTGSCGDGYRLAEKLGHKIIEPKASLVPLTSPDTLCGELQGLSLKNISMKIYEDDELVYEDFGEMLFTHFGLSGPLVLSASAHIRNWGKKKCRAVIDLKPALDEKTLDKRILRDFSEELNKDFGNSLSQLLPSKLIPVIVRLSGIPHAAKVNSITKEQRKKLIALVKHLEFEINGTRPIDEAIITSGGVSVREINPKTMESKLVRGLYFAGEVIDVDAYTGGFNLQIAWSTGHAAGEAMG